MKSAPIEKPSSQVTRADNSRSPFRDVVSIVCFAVFGFLITLLVAVFESGASQQARGWVGPFLEVMSYYLVFVFIRTLFHLFFSFLSFFFRAERQPLRDFPLVSILIPCYNEEKVIQKAVESALTVDYPNFEILVIDDGSHDLTLIEAKKIEGRSRVRVINQNNGGKAHALNNGIAQARGEYVLCMDADSILDSQVIRNALPHFQQNPGLAAVAGNVRLGNSGGGLLTAFQKLEYISGLNFLKEAQSFLKSVSVVPGPIGIFKKSAILSIGGYRTDTFAEDADLSLRLLMHGFDTIYDCDVIAHTEGPEDVRSFLSQRYRWTRGMLQTIRVNIGRLVKRGVDFRSRFVLLYMICETILMPTANFIFSFVSLQLFLWKGSNEAILFFFGQLTVLDMLLTLYSVVHEKNRFSLVGLSVIGRITYGLFLEILRFFALLDELAHNPMNWGKLERKGMNG